MTMSHPQHFRMPFDDRKDRNGVQSTKEEGKSKEKCYKKEEILQKKGRLQPPSYIASFYQLLLLVLNLGYYYQCYKVKGPLVWFNLVIFGDFVTSVLKVYYCYKVFNCTYKAPKNSSVLGWFRFLAIPLHISSTMYVVPLAGRSIYCQIVKISA